GGAAGAPARGGTPPLGAQPRLLLAAGPPALGLVPRDLPPRPAEDGRRLPHPLPGHPRLPRPGGEPGPDRSPRHRQERTGHRLAAPGPGQRLPRPLLQRPDLIDELYASLADHSTTRVLKRLAAYDLLVLDELGYMNLQPEHANALFQLLEQRYARKSTLITINLLCCDQHKRFYAQSVLMRRRRSEGKFIV
ncbi:MAG: ATP-binding protein, partial [Nitrococcus mobilis]|nr:ATP-binding protein [Nitrococcus mobilis]